MESSWSRCGWTSIPASGSPSSPTQTACRSNSTNVEHSLSLDGLCFVLPVGITVRCDRRVLVHAGVGRPFDLTEKRFTVSDEDLSDEETDRLLKSAADKA